MTGFLTHAIMEKKIAEVKEMGLFDRLIKRKQKQNYKPLVIFIHNDPVSVMEMDTTDTGLPLLVLTAGYIHALSPESICNYLCFYITANDSGISSLVPKSFSKHSKIEAISSRIHNMCGIIFVYDIIAYA